MEELDLHLTNRCNLRCRHCCFNSGRFAMPELSTAQVCQMLDDAVELGVREVHLTGGEPFLRPDVLTIVQEASRRGAKVRIQSNGTLLEEGQLEQLVGLGISELMISIDGTEQHNDGIRGNGIYRKAWNTVLLADGLGIPVRVNTVVMKENLAAASALLRRTLDLGINVHSFFHFTPFGTGEELQAETVGPRDWLTFIEELKKICEDFSARDTSVVVEQVFMRQDEAERQQPGCRIRQKHYCQLLCDGSVSPCTFLMYPGLFLGNVRRASLKSIWSDLTNWQQYDKYMGLCGACERFEACKGGCWLYSFSRDKTFSRDPRCNLSDNIIPVCPYLKRNLRAESIAHSTASAIESN